MVSPRGVVARVPFEKPDAERTRTAQERAAAQVRVVYSQDKAPIDRLRDGLKNRIAEIAAAESVTSSSRAAWLEFAPEAAPVIDALAAAGGAIGISADGAMTWTAVLSTYGDVNIRTAYVSDVLRSFSSVAPIETKYGTISINASSISLGGSLIVSDSAPSDPRRTDISLLADNGNVVIGGLVKSPNQILVNATAPKSGRVSGAGRIETRNLSMNAVRVGNPEGNPTDPLFYLRTGVDSWSGEVQAGVAIDDTSVSPVWAPEREGGPEAWGPSGGSMFTRETYETIRAARLPRICVPMTRERYQCIFYDAQAEAVDVHFAGGA
jgi:hypothetical protein